MPEYKPNYREIKSIATLEPGLKDVYVEGMSDYFLINDFLRYHKVKDVKVYAIDDIDFDELSVRMDPDKASELKQSNKEKVIYLSQLLEKDFSDVQLSILCIVDIDWDRMLSQVRTSRYLCYTDYNSMDLYLCTKEIIAKYLRQGHRINTNVEDSMINTLLSVCRQIFHVHCIMHEKHLPIVNNDKAFTFDKTNQSCILDFNRYWIATLSKNNLTAISETLKATYDSRISQPGEDLRYEVRGHDFVYYLYLCARKMKSKMKMDDEEFANMFWNYADLEVLKEEDLFAKILNL